MLLPEYTATLVQEIFSINRNTLKQWLNSLFIHASINRSSKQGDANLFSQKDIICIQLFMHLIKRGLRLRDASIMVDFLYTPTVARIYDGDLLRFLHGKNEPDEKLLFYIRIYDDGGMDSLIDICRIKDKEPLMNIDIIRKLDVQFYRTDHKVTDIHIVDLSSLIDKINI